MATPAPTTSTYTTSGGSIVNPAGFSAGVLAPGFTNAAGQQGDPSVGTNVVVPATQSTQGNNPANNAILNNYVATLPNLTPTTSGSSTAQTNTVNPPVVANSNAASTDLNNIQNNANVVGGAVNSQNQANIANTNAQTQALNSGAGTGTGAGDSSSSSTNPDDQPITAGDLNAALNSVNGSGSNDSSGNNTGQVTTTTDANGNQIQSVTPPTEDNTDLNNTLSQIQQNAQQTIDPLKAQLAQQQQQVIDISNQQIQAAQDTQNQIQGLLNGTLPLSAGDQAQLAGIQATYNELISTAQGAAQAYVAGVQAEGLASGKGMYNPSINLSLINNATQAGISKVQTLTAQGAAAYAKLQSDLQNSDLTAIQDSYKAMSDALTARSTAVQGMVKDTQDAITQAYTQQQNEITDAFKSATLSDTEKQNIYNDALNNAKFTETQKQDITDDYYKGVEASQNAQKIAISQEDVGIKLQTLKDSEDSASLSAANAATTTGSGNTYIDGTNLDAAGKAAGIKAGIPVLEGNDAKAMDTITEGQNAYSAIMSSFNKLGIVNSQGQFVGNANTAFAGNGNSVRQAISSYNTEINTVIKALQTSGDSKIDGSVISDLQNSILSTDSPNSSDLNTKLTSAFNALSNGENSILSNAATGTVINGATYKANADGSYTRIQ